MKVREALRSVGKEAELKGWVYRIRKQKEIVFILLRDETGIIQCLCKGDLAEKARKLHLESAIRVKGKVVASGRAPGGAELHAEELEIIHLAEPFPIGKQISTELTLAKRHLWVRSQRMTKLMMIKDVTIRAAFDFFSKEGFYFVTPPVIQSGLCEPGSAVFEIDYFGEKAFLSQSAQLYLEALIFSLGKVWTLMPSFRAEKSRTRRHLTEYWHLEAEAAWCDFDCILDLQERLVSHLCQAIAKECEEELKFFGREASDLLRIKPPFKRITYDEAVELIKQETPSFEYGQDFGADEERVLSLKFDKPFFVTHYPIEIKAFYVKEDPERKGYGLTADLMAPEGYGELTTGGERETDIEKMKSRLIAEGLDVKGYEWYFDLRRYGSVQHSGFGLGIERFLMWICKLEHVREAMPFPRLARRRPFP